MEKDLNLLENGLILEKQDPSKRNLVLPGVGGRYSGLGIVATGGNINLNVRAGGGTNHAQVGSLPNGAIVSVERYDGDPSGWVRIVFHVTDSGTSSTSYRGRWVSSAYLTNGGDRVAGSLRANNRNMVTTTSGLRVRKWPDTSDNSNIIATLPNGARVRSFYTFGRNGETFGGGYRDEWHYIGRVNPDDRGGWVSGLYVRYV